jgi:hypothetical protein
MARHDTYHRAMGRESAYRQHHRMVRALQALYMERALALARTRPYKWVVVFCIHFHQKEILLFLLDPVFIIFRDKSP